MTLGADANGAEQAEGCRFIGGVVGMLKTDASSSCIPLPILEKAKEQLVTKIEAKIAKTELEEHLAEASSWGVELSALVSKFESVGAAKADEQNKSTQADSYRGFLGSWLPKSGGCHHRHFIYRPYRGFSSNSVHVAPVRHDKIGGTKIYLRKGDELSINKIELRD